MDPLAEKYYWLWRDRVAARRYRDWCEFQDELAAEAEFATMNNMESVLWCWTCKHSDCNRHRLRPCCAGKTQRGRDCHFTAVKFCEDRWLCKYHA